MKAILIVGHGSRDQEGNDQVRTFIKNLSAKIDESGLVETCFLEFEQPTVDQGINTCVQKGAKEVIIIPLMLLQAGHSKIHIPASIDVAKMKYPGVKFTYGRPIGIHDESTNICVNRLTELGENVEEPESDTAVILLGRGGSDPDANSDLYKIGRLLWEKTNYKIIEPAFMGVTDPLLQEGVERCLKLGAKKIIILPYFLFTGILIKRLEELMEQFKIDFHENEFKLADFFGFHEGLETIVIDRIEEALKDEVKMNCDTCQYRINAAAYIGHHHHHDHDHEHHHHSHDHIHEEKEVQKLK